MVNKWSIRSWKKSDLTKLVKMANNKKIACYLTDKFPNPYTEQDGQDFLDKAIANPFFFYAIDFNGEAIGSIAVLPQEDNYQLNAEMGYFVDENYWGKGVGSFAINQMINKAFTELQIKRIFARPFSSNKASHRILEKNNFVLEAKFEKTILKNGELLDELVYALRKENWLKRVFLTKI